MTDFLRMTVVFFATVNPFAVMLASRDLPHGRRRIAAITAGIGLGIATGLLALAAAAADPLLDFLDVAPETFRLAAGVVMLTAAVHVVWRGRMAAAPALGDWKDGVFPLALPLLAGPAALVAAVSYGAGEGPWLTFLAAMPWLAVAAALAWLGPSKRLAWADALARITGALLVAAAAGLIVDGVRAI